MQLSAAHLRDASKVGRDRAEAVDSSSEVQLGTREANSRREFVAPQALPTTYQSAIELLTAARRDAQHWGMDQWQFAVDLESMRRAGLSVNDIRQLILARIVDHKHETTAPSSKSRSFRNIDSLLITPATCFVIADPSGILRMTAIHELTPPMPAATGPGPFIAAEKDPPPATLRPRWDANLRNLYLGTRLVKRFRVPAVNQTQILKVFEVEGWTQRIDDPLYFSAAVDPVERLRETIKSLNRNQTVPLIRFYGDGTGRGVCWGLANALRDATEV